MSLICGIVTSQIVRNCAMLFKVWKDRWVLTSYRVTLCWSLFGIKVLRGYWENVQVRVENISRFCLSSNELEVSSAWTYSFINQKQPTVQRMYAVDYDLVFRNEKKLSAGRNSWTIIFAEFRNVCIPFTASFFTNTDISFVYMLARALRKIHFLQCWYKLSQFISPHIHYIVQCKDCVLNPGIFMWV